MRRKSFGRGWETINSGDAGRLHHKEVSLNQEKLIEMLSDLKASEFKYHAYH